MYCRYCGKLVEDDSAFCKYCGNNLVSEIIVKKTCQIQFCATSSIVPLFCDEFFSKIIHNTPPKNS